jgi:hypothetical protein
MDPNYLYQTIDAALAEAGPATKAPLKTAAHKQSGE